MSAENVTPEQGVMQGTDSVLSMRPLPPVKSIDLVVRAWAIAEAFGNMESKDLPPGRHREQLRTIHELLNPIVNSYKAGNL